MERAQKDATGRRIRTARPVRRLRRRKKLHANNDKLPNTPDWDEHVRLAAEKEILGFFITGHPLDKYKEKLEDLRALSTQEVCAMKNSTGKDESITTAGIICNLKVLEIQEGRPLRAGRARRHAGTVEMLVFPEAFRKLRDKVKLTVPVLIRCGVRVEEGSNAKITINDISPLEEVKVPLPSSLRIRIPLETATETTVDALHSLFSDEKGRSQGVV